ncbi:hypothetical protein GCM10022261_11180 [Brevibacterium daeguense]|uniref:Uncharacterized protein n=1 Tax=Brevibacterium daeguense TaxID=909936 RepID=A0ABP8EI19_9MICO
MEDPRRRAADPAKAAVGIPEPSNVHTRLGPRARRGGLLGVRLTVASCADLSKFCGYRLECRQADFVAECRESVLVHRVLVHMTRWSLSFVENCSRLLSCG